MILKRFNHEVLDEEAVGMKRRGLGFAVSAGVAIACLLAAGALGSAQAPAAQVTLLSVQQNNQLWPTVLSAVTKGYNKVAPGSSFTNDYVPQQTINQKIQLEASQNALPLLYNTPAVNLVAQMDKSGQVLDVAQEFQKLGVSNELVPAATAILKKLYGGKVLALPLEFNLEGVWYNKKIFAANGIAVPKTWNQFVAAAAKLQAAGIQPFAASGIQGWPITRLIGNYIFSTIGAERDAGRAAG